MVTLTPARSRAALFALALGGFGIGTTEFATMGLLPEIASGFDVLHPDRGRNAITAYALGVVVGAPDARSPGRPGSQPAVGLLLLLVVAFTIGNVLVRVRPEHRAGWCWPGSPRACRTVRSSGSAR